MNSVCIAISAALRTATLRKTTVGCQSRSKGCTSKQRGAQVRFRSSPIEILIAERTPAVTLHQMGFSLGKRFRACIRSHHSCRAALDCTVPRLQPSWRRVLCTDAKRDTKSGAFAPRAHYSDKGTQRRPRLFWPLLLSDNMTAVVTRKSIPTRTVGGPFSFRSPQSENNKQRQQQKINQNHSHRPFRICKCGKGLIAAAFRTAVAD